MGFFGSKISQRLENTLLNLTTDNFPEFIKFNEEQFQQENKEMEERKLKIKNLQRVKEEISKQRLEVEDIKEKSNGIPYKSPVIKEETTIKSIEEQLKHEEYQIEQSRRMILTLNFRYKKHAKHAIDKLTTPQRVYVVRFESNEIIDVIIETREILQNKLLEKISETDIANTSKSLGSLLSTEESNEKENRIAEVTEIIVQR